MSPAQNKYPQPPQPPRPPSSEVQADAQASSSPKPPPSADPIMDQHPESTLIATPPTPPKVMSSSAPDQDSLPASPASVSSEPPAAPLPAANQDSGDSVSEPSIALRQQPIPPASEPMQYRAIGLVRGRYVPSEEQFTRGTLQSDDGVPIDAVLLGRVMSLVKKHLDLEQPHLWVVYPRTREKAEDLHVQIVGVWEPEKLNRADGLPDETAESQDEDIDEDTDLDGETEPEAPEAEAPEAEAPEAEAVEPPLQAEAPKQEGEAAGPKPEAKPEVYVSASELDDRYFSVRGEVVYQAMESEQLLVKIRRSPRQGSDQSKAFKVALKGVLEGKAVGYFWDFQVQRQENLLVVQQATMIGMVPPTKRSKGAGGRPQRGGRRGPGGPGRPGGPGGPGARKRWNSREGGPPQRGERPSIRPQREQREQREPIAKPIIKRRPKDNSTES